MSTHRVDVSAPASPSAPAIATQMGGAEWAQLLLLSLIWGGSFFLVAIALTGLPVLTIVTARVGIAALVLWLVVALTGSRLPRDPAIWAAFLVMGFLNNVVPFGLIVWGQTAIPSGLASILNATTPLWTVLISAALLSDEAATPAKLAGVVLGLGGVAVMIGLDTLAGLGHAILPQLAILGAAIAYGFAGVFGRRFRRMGVDPITSSAGMVTGSTLILLPVMLTVDGLPGPGVPVSVWLAVAALGILCTGLAYVLYFRILARAGATNLSLVTFLVPVSAILLGWLFLNEELGTAHLLGVLMIAGGLALIDGRLMRRLRA